MDAPSGLVGGFWSTKMLPLTKGSLRGVTNPLLVSPGKRENQLIKHLLKYTSKEARRRPGSSPGTGVSKFFGQGTVLAIISKCHPEPFGVAQDKLREGSKVTGNMILTLLPMVQLKYLMRFYWLRI